MVIAVVKMEKVRPMGLAFYKTKSFWGEDGRGDSPSTKLMIRRFGMCDNVHVKLCQGCV